jgi:hypothetical protein
MNNQIRRPFRPRTNKPNFRGRSSSSRQGSNGHFQSSNGNNKFSRNNGSMTNPFNVEKTIQKFQQLAKDAQSTGDPVLVENYLQHADHYSRRLSELNARSKPSVVEKEPREEKTKNTQAEEKKDTSISEEVLKKKD